MRSAAFDRQQVLRNAMQVFMHKGYSKTSMQQLTKATGLHPGSIYCAFKNKRGLLLAAIEQYHMDTEAHIATIFVSDKPFVQCLQHYLDDVVNECLQCHDSGGCLLIRILSEVRGEDEEINGKLITCLDAWQTQLQDIFSKAITANELAQNKDAASCARYLTTMIYGLRTYSYTHPQIDELLALRNDILHYITCGAPTAST